jgi:hypothetical protein
VVVSALLVLFSAVLVSGQGSSGGSSTAVGSQRPIQTPVDVVSVSRERAIDPIEFRERLMVWALASERAFGRGMQLSERIAALSNEQLTIWLSTIEEPDAFLRSTERVTNRLREPRKGESGPRRFETQTPTTLTTPFPPDYPPASGPYNDVILGAITGFGIAASNTNGCDAGDWADYVAVWWPLNKTFDTLDGACVVAGCDPTGIACAIACGVLETAKVALKVAAVRLGPVRAGARLEGAEIEATYENTLGLVGTRPRSRRPRHARHVGQSAPGGHPGGHEREPEADQDLHESPARGHATLDHA